MNFFNGYISGTVDAFYFLLSLIIILFIFFFLSICYVLSSHFAGSHEVFQHAVALPLPPKDPTMHFFSMKVFNQSFKRFISFLLIEKASNFILKYKTTQHLSCNMLY